MRSSTALMLAAVLLLPPAGAARAQDAAKEKAPAAKPDASEKAEPARKALEKPLPEVGFDTIPLGDATDFLRDVGGVTIWLDHPSLKKVEIDPAKTVITMKLKKGQTLKEALAMLAKQMVGTNEERSVAEPCGAVVVISTEDGAKAFVERHRKALARVRKDAPKLDRELPEVTFDGVPLTDIVDFLKDVTGAAITVDWGALETAGVERNSPVHLRAREVKFAQALRLVLDDVTGQKPLDFAAKGDRIFITAASSMEEAEKKLDNEGGL